MNNIAFKIGNVNKSVFSAYVFQCMSEVSYRKLGSDRKKTFQKMKPYKNECLTSMPRNTSFPSFGKPALSSVKDRHVYDEEVAPMSSKCPPTFTGHLMPFKAQCMENIILTK